MAVVECQRHLRILEEVFGKIQKYFLAKTWKPVDS